MRRIMHAAILAASLTGSVALAQAQAPTPGSAAGITEIDKQFLIVDAQGSLYEMSIAALAQQRSSRDDIKAYATRIIQDHSSEGAALQQLAAAKHVALPTEMTADDRNKLNGMNLQTGNTLDRSFIAEAMRINEEDRKDAQEELAATSDPDIKAFLQRFAATDAQHESMARALQNK